MPLFGRLDVNGNRKQHKMTVGRSFGILGAEALYFAGDIGHRVDDESDWGGGH